MPVKKILKRVGLVVLVIVLVGPFLVPFKTSGTMTKEEAAQTLWGDQSKWVTLANQEVHYIEAGDPNSQRLIILLHGFGASAFSYKENIEPLAQLGHVIAYDRAAFGFTERPTKWETNPYGMEGQMQVLDEVVDEFGANKEVWIVGHSMGGRLAANYSIKNQEKLTGVVLFAPAVMSDGGTPSWLNWIYYIPQINHIGPHLVSSIATNGLGLLYQSYYDESKVTQNVLDGYRAPLQVAGWEKAFWEFNRAPRGESPKDRLGEIKIPTLVLTGDTDTVVPTADSIQVSKIIKKSELVVIEKTGHLPNEEAPEKFAQAIISFIGSR